MSQLKDIYTSTFLSDFADSVISYQPNFPKALFLNDIFSNEWESLSLRQRMKKIATLLGEYLDGSYDEQLPIILKLHEQNGGFNYLFLPDFVSIYGLTDSHFDLSLDYLKHLTPYSSSEFAIREFILKDNDYVLKLLIQWSLDENEHVRRLASEGSRPTLPWGVKLDVFNNNPLLTLPILEHLKNDSSLYVRKSVANHLNDLSKKHPDFVVETSKRWLNQSEETDWIIRRACRTLIKKAYPKALALFGYETPGTSFDILSTELTIDKHLPFIGDSLIFHYHIETSLTKETLIRLEYGIDYMKDNGKPSLKKFHLTDSLTQKQLLTGQKHISFKDLTTRKHYPGIHQLCLYLNGQQIDKLAFELKDKKEDDI